MDLLSVTKRDLLLAVFGSAMVLTMRTPSVLSSSLPLFGFFSPLLFLVVGHFVNLMCRMLFYMDFWRKRFI